MNRGCPAKPETKRQRNQRVIRLNDFYTAALIEIAEEDGSNPALLAENIFKKVSAKDWLKNADPIVAAFRLHNSPN